MSSYLVLFLSILAILGLLHFRIQMTPEYVGVREAAP